MDKQSKETKIKEYLQKVDPVFQKLLIDLLKEMPQNYIEFSMKWLDTKGRQMYQETSKSTPATKEKHQKKQQKAAVPSDDSEEDEDDHVDDLEQEEFKKKLLAKQNNVAQRISVSAEVYGQFNKKTAYVPKVVPKDQEQKNRIEKRLMQAFMFNSLDEREREIVVNAMQEVKYKAGDWIIRQGEDGDVLYVIDQGELDCFKRFTKDGENKYLKTYKPGEAFGELALLYNAPRAASIQAKSESVLFSLDRECFNNIVKDSAIKKRERFEQTLQNVELLDSMDPYERVHLCDGMRDAKYKKGEYVIRQGEQGTNFYMIEEGELKATKTDANGNEKTVYEYKEGDYFGELALVKNIPRQANVVAVTDVKLVYLDFETFKRLMGPIEEILKRNEKRYAKYNQENLENLDS